MIIGAGLFGSYAAVFLDLHGFRIVLVERETSIFSKASVANQARLHAGYHYPRSIATAQLANSYQEKFYSDHVSFVNLAFKKYYAIDKLNSLTDGRQFQRFCATLQLPCIPVERNDLFVWDRLEAVFETVEYGFDPYLIREFYAERLRDSSVTVMLGAQVTAADGDQDRWAISVESENGVRRHFRARGVINCTYANINSVNRLFGISELKVTHELSELVLIKSKALANIGLTVMDGPFVSVMPYGLSGLHSLSSVPYTHHAYDEHNDPVFECQALRPDCTPAAVRTCNTCSVRPRSNQLKMKQQLRLYVRPEVDISTIGSLFTVKTKLRRSFIDDSRPTEISVLRQDPLFVCVFSGKMHSIYEIERVLDYV
jgi:hypothetical protein